MSEWRDVTLGDVIELHDHKRIPLSATIRKTRQGPYPYYGAQGVIDYIDDYIFDGRYILIPEDGANLNTRKLPIAYFAEGQFWVNNHAHIASARDGVAVDRFVQSALEATDISGFITGAAQPKLSQANLLMIPLRVPAYSEQLNIGKVLDALDDLIENSRRRIALLEQIAQATYREWFVHFRYPGHESDELTDSQVGPVPRGWHVATLADGLPFSLTKPPITPYDGTRPYVATADCSGVHEISTKTWLAFDVLPTRAQHEPIPNSVWFGRMAGYSKIMLFPGSSVAEYTLSSGFACLRCEPEWFSYVAMCVLAPEFESVKTRHATGATQVSLTDAGAKSIPWLVPPSDLCARFDNVVGGQIALLLRLQQRNRSLQSIQDELLPRLVSGGIDVSKLDLDALLDETAA